MLSVREGLELVLQLFHIPLEEDSTTTPSSVESGYDSGVLVSHRVDRLKVEEDVASPHLLFDRVHVHFLELYRLYTVLDRLPVLVYLEGVVGFWFSLIVDV